MPSEEMAKEALLQLRAARPVVPFVTGAESVVEAVGSDVLGEEDVAVLALYRGLAYLKLDLNIRESLTHRRFLCCFSHRHCLTFG